MVAERTDRSTITRSTVHFNKAPFRSANEAQQCSPTKWPTGPVSESTLSAGENGRPGMGPSEKTTTEAGAGELIQEATPATLQSLQAARARKEYGGVRGSEKPLTVVLN